MLYVFCGNDTSEVRREAFLLVHAKEADGARARRISSEEYVPGIFTDLLGAVSLFGEKEVYLIDTPSQASDMYEDVLQNLEAFSESTNTFLILETTLLAPEKKKFAKYAENLVEVKSATAVRYNPFSMADALASKDKKNLWLLLQDAKRAGLSAEEIIGTLWWQLKSLRIAKVTKNAEEAGMKDYSYNKTKRALSAFKVGEIESLSRSLLVVYHEGHSGVRDTDLALEKWILQI